MSMTISDEQEEAALEYKKFLLRSEIRSDEEQERTARHRERQEEMEHERIEIFRSDVANVNAYRDKIVRLWVATVAVATALFFVAVVATIKYILG